jgi:tetratricopeptide (TPR) repeat protein
MSGENYDLDLIDMTLTLPSQKWHLWPWAEAAHARGWKNDYALVEAFAREGLMRDPNETNFHASVISSLYEQKLLAESNAEIPRAERALTASKSKQMCGESLCLLECMISLARAGRYADAVAIKQRHDRIDDANLQAMLSMCLAAVGDHAAAREAFARAANIDGAPYYVLQSYRRTIYEHAAAVIALLPPDPDPDEAIAALTRGSYYNQRDWFKHDPNLAALRDDPRFIALVSQW